MSMVSEQDRLWVGSMPEAYDRWLAPSVFRPFAQHLARRAARLAPRQVLEIAAGTGVLTSELIKALPGADVTATDLNAAMVEFGSRQAPGAEWRQADALGLPFDDDRFDLVACQFGVMFFPDKPAAFAEVRRVLAPGGALLLTTWGDVGTHGFALPWSPGSNAPFPTTRRPSWPRCHTATSILTKSLPTLPLAVWETDLPRRSRWTGTQTPPPAWRPDSALAHRSE
jgi:SAM-dependent methyltransferase